METTEAIRLTLNRKEAARKLGISVVTLDREIARRRIRHFRVGRRVLFTDELLREYITQKTEATENGNTTR